MTICDATSTRTRDSQGDRTSFECRICWYVYDPEMGDAQEQVPAGTPFRSLPKHWRCPQCDGGPELFLARGD